MSIAHRCVGCGWVVPEGEAPFACRHASANDGRDHVLARDPLPADTRWAPDDKERNPFLRYRALLSPWRLAMAGGLGDAGYVDIVKQLDRRIAAIDGGGFTMTPLVEAHELATAVHRPALRIKDETVGVAGSHKARHLFGTAIELAVRAALGASPSTSAPLAIASCGNAALAAAVVARAAGRRLLVFIPPHADSVVVDRLRRLGAELTVCGREAPAKNEPPPPPGDPCVHAFRRAVSAGALPFSCQGGDNALAIDGGRTLAYEIVEQLHVNGVDELYVQVGGGALASALAQGLDDAVQLGALAKLPRLVAVQTAGGHPLERAFVKLLAWRAANGASIEATLAHAATHRADFMWPWESEPHSLAHGILDDETYDWLAIAAALLRSGGATPVVTEAAIAEANQLARGLTSIDVDHTGSSGLAALVGAPPSDQSALVLFTGRRRK